MYRQQARQTNQNIITTNNNDDNVIIKDVSTLADIRQCVWRCVKCRLRFRASGVRVNKPKLRDGRLCCLCTKQEAQLSQRNCAMLLVTEYFANSLKVTQGHSHDTLV